MKEPFENLFWRLFQWVRVVLMGLGLLLLIVTFTPLTAWWTQLLEGPWTEARGDVLVVLTGSILGNGILGESSYWRSVYTVIAWQEGGWREVLVSGGGAGRVETADGMRIFLEAGGVPS
ncbi:MAG: hypothetical protein ACREQC_16360, partial [Candidatus Binataceae bacterium]